MNRNRFFLTIAGAALSLAATAVAQSPAPTWSLGPMELSGYVDGYYTYNANRPSEAANGQKSELINFNDRANQFNLNMAKLTLKHDADPVGARIDLMLGRTNYYFNFGNEDQLNYVEQAYLSFKPEKAKGFQLDMGKFVTSAGNEVTENTDNWNYSRSLLFSWAAPFFHFGIRTAMPVSKTDTVGVQVVNGWNNVTKSNGGVTLGFTNSLVQKNYTWNVTYYGGPEHANSQKGTRHLVDSAFIYTPSDKFNLSMNYDYGQDRQAPLSGGALNRWQGISGGAKTAFNPSNFIAVRYDYFKDHTGWATGTAQTLQEVTATYVYRHPAGLKTFLEYRRDWSDQSFFTKGDTLGAKKSQDTVTLGMVAFFGPKR